MFELTKRRALHITIAVLHTITFCGIAAALNTRSKFVQEGKLKLACTFASSNTTQSEREQLRMALPLEIKDGAWCTPSAHTALCAHGYIFVKMCACAAVRMHCERRAEWRRQQR